MWRRGLSASARGAEVGVAWRGGGGGGGGARGGWAVLVGAD